MISILEQMKKEDFISANYINHLFLQIKDELERLFPEKTISFTRTFTSYNVFKPIEVFENIEDILIFLESIDERN